MPARCVAGESIGSPVIGRKIYRRAMRRIDPPPLNGEPAKYLAGAANRSG